MLIKLRNKRDVDALMKRRTTLKDVGFPGIYLTKDLTPDEREEQKRLRNELSIKGKDKHVIFRGRVVPKGNF